MKTMETHREKRLLDAKPLKSIGTMISTIDKLIEELDAGIDQRVSSDNQWQAQAE